MLLAATILAAVTAAAGVRQTPAVAPFALPPSVTAVVGSADGRGWSASGELKLAFKSAQARLATSIAAGGWSHVHTISLGKDRVLDAWSRGEEELTVMVWRISAGKSGFSYGLSAKDVKSAPATGGATNVVKSLEAKDGGAL